MTKELKKVLEAHIGGYSIDMPYKGMPMLIEDVVEELNRLEYELGKYKLANRILQTKMGTLLQELERMQGIIEK